MSAYAGGYSRGGGGGLLLFALLAFVGLLAFFGLMAFSPELNTHAVEVHASDATLVRDACRDDRNILQIWEQTDGRNHLLCDLGDGRVGDHIVVYNEVREEWCEVTSFVPKGDNVTRIVSWLLRKGATLIWSR